MEDFEVQTLAPVRPGADYSEQLVADLNPPQRRAVEYGEGPLLVIAGAGSGKTRVLTRRIAYLVATGQAHPSEILAITFTNKAAGEMRERVESLVGGVSRLMWVMTFHSACARILRANAERLGYKKAFTIYDQADSLRMVKRVMAECDVDPKRFSARSIQGAISGAKNRLQDSTDYAAMQGGYFEETVAEVYSLYERRMVEASAMDFDDLLVRTVNLLELFSDIRERYQRTFRWILVDEYQDTNRAQYRLLQLLAGEAQNLTVVGDDAQCLVEGTQITMADRTEKGIEELVVGDEVLSCYGSGDFRASTVSGVFRAREDAGGVAIMTRGGRRIVSTKEHMHFAGYRGRRSERPNRHRRVVDVSMCAERTRMAPLHSVSMAGRDAYGREALERVGLRVRPATGRTGSWRFEVSTHDLSNVARLVGEIGSELDVDVRCAGHFAETPLPCVLAASVKPGMAMFTVDGGYDIVERVEAIEMERPVYDINVDGTHNFIANGLVTHNSVYSFRSADVRNILEFEQDYEDAEVVKLEQNYRSTQTILDAANAVIANNKAQKPKHLWTEAGRGDLVTVAELDDEHAEARYVAGEIERLVGDEDFSRTEIAVLYRMNAQSRVLEDTLVRYEVPYQVIGGTKFYERAEIKDAVAYLQLIANPADGISFARVVNSPRRGIGQQTQARLLSHANTTGEDIWDVMSRPQALPGMGAAAVKAVSRFAAIMAGLRERAQSDSVADLLESVLHDSGYIESLEAERTIEAEGRIENLEELVGVAREADANREVEGDLEQSALEDFLARISLFTDQDSIRDSESLITLMSLHNAKGLEYDAVFIIGCEEGVFPHSRSIEEGNLEEERRLAYVGVTRARKRLTLTCARTRSLHGSSGWNLPSRFLREVPSELVDHKAMAVKTGWQSGGSSFGGGGRGFGGGGGLKPADRKRPETPAIEFRIGDDVVHASFGEGVVTSVEPGSVVVVRFAGAGGERKLMADYAPLKKCG